MSPSTLVLHRADKLACREWIAHHSKSFYLSSLLLPEHVREAAWALYAFCRRADDAVDDASGQKDGMRRVEALRRRLDSVYRGDPQSSAIDRAFAGVADEYGIPRALPDELLAGMEMDARGVTYDTDEELLRYCFRVASVVGLMMTCAMGAKSPEVAYLRAADLGAAMQLTNIARDIGEDARRGRVYLPRTICDEVGLDPKTLLAGRAVDEPVRRAVKRLLVRADAHYRAADLGIPLLPRGCRLAIASSRRIYPAIGRVIAKNGYDSVNTRAHVTLGGKLWLVLGAIPSVFARAGRRSRQSVGPADDQFRGWIATCGLPT